MHNGRFGMGKGIEEYRKDVRHAADEDSNGWLPHDELEKVAWIRGVLFGRAKGTVFMVTHHLNPLLYRREDVQEAVKKFLQKRGSKLNIVVQFDKGMEKSLSIGGSNNFLESLRDYAGRISVFRAAGELKHEKSCMVTKTITGKYATWRQLDKQDLSNTACFNAGRNTKELFKRLPKMISSLEKIPIKKLEPIDEGTIVI